MKFEDLQSNKLKFILASYGTYMLYHKVEENKVLAGNTLTKETAQELFHYLKDEKVNKEYFFKGMIPRNVLSFNTKSKEIIWYVEPSFKYLCFSKELPIEQGNYPLPFLIFKLTKSNLSVFATKQSPIEENIELFHAPFLNCYEDGSMCMGNAAFNSKSLNYQKVMQKVEYGFFSSVFTHTNHDFILKDKSIVEMYQKQLATPKKHFNLDLLNPINLTLKDIL